MHSFFTTSSAPQSTAIQRPTNPIFEAGVVKARRAEMTLTTNDIDDLIDVARSPANRSQRRQLSAER